MLIVSSACVRMLYDCLLLLLSIPYNNTKLTRLQVFTAIKENSMHVPYRNSKLTYLLQDSIGGDAKAMVFINISPLEVNMRETSSTLMFGQVS